MSDAAGKLRTLLSAVSIAPSAVHVVHNVDVAEHPDADDLRAVLAAQLHESVRWTETVRHLAGQGVTHIVECGPGKVLAGLNKRIAPDCRSVPIHDPESFAVARELMV
jgi:[acyl-carrier-protein] S-malonyltransferase